MFNIVGVIKNKNRIVAYDIMDSNGDTRRITKDKVINAINNNQIANAKIQIWQGKPIVRVLNKKQNLTFDKTVYNSIVSNDRAIAVLNKLEVGTPIRVKASNNCDWEQAIYCGKEVDRYTFFDDSGISGIFQFSVKFLKENGDVKFDTEDNDAVKVVALLNSMRKKKIIQVY